MSSLTMATLNADFYEPISVEPHHGNTKRWFYELISVERHFLTLSATKFSTLHFIGKMKILTSLTARLSYNFGEMLYEHAKL